MKEDSLVSVIVPVYNVELYIQRCLDSISRQTYKNIEIITVDDGSCDDSALICDYCASLDKRIKVIRKQNEGAGFARNSGIDIAKGKYLFFIDSDDYIIETCIERLVEVAEKEKADIVKCSWIKGYEESYHICPQKRDYHIFDNVEAFRTRKINISITGKLFRREVIGDQRYPQETEFDDEFFTYRLIYNSRRILLLDEIYYYYFMSPKSIMRGEKKEQPMQFVKAYEERILFFDKKNEKELSGISHKELAIRMMLSYVKRGDYAGCVMTEKEMLDRFKSEYSIGKRYAIGMKEKISLFMFNCAPFLSRRVIKYFI